MAIRQGPLTRAAQPRDAPPPDAQALARAEQAIEGVEDEALRKALILTRRPRPARPGGEKLVIAKHICALRPRGFCDSRRDRI